MDDGDSLSRHEGDRFGVWRAKICRTDTGKAGSVDGRRGFRLADTERGGSVSAVGFRAWQTRRAADWWLRMERIFPDCIIPDSGGGIDQEVH